jgi:tetratricopeptide (TPR) repeat protein
MNDPEIVRNAVLNLSDIAMVEGDPAKALNLLREVESSCAADATRGAEWMKWRYIQHLWASLSAAHLAVGDPAAALEYADRCLADAARTRSMRYLVRGREERARALAAQGAGDDSIADATEASHLADQIGSPTLRWRSRLTLGDVLGTADRQEDAAAAHAAGLQILEAVSGTLTDSTLRAGLLDSEEAVRLREGARA